MVQTIIASGPLSRGQINWAHLFLERAFERDGKLLRECAQSWCLLLELLELIAGDPLGWQVDHAVLEFVAKGAQSLIDALAEAIVEGSKDDRGDDAAHRGPELGSRDFHQLVEPILHRIHPAAEVQGG